MNHTRQLWWAAATTATVLVAACGGRNEGPPPIAQDPTAVPASAGVSTTSFINFIKSLNPNDETSEPLTLSDSFAVPDDDTGEPEILT